MPGSKRSLLLHPLFLLSLFLLVANDHWWKQAFGNALTGKISDFAGVLVLAVFLVACLRFSKVSAIILTAFIFTWWKSPLSQPFINAFHLTRVIDYSDLFALLILPLVFLMHPFGYKYSIKYVSLVVGLFTFMAMVATSLPYQPGFRYPPGRMAVNKEWKMKLTVDEFFQKLDSLHITWRKDSVEYLPAAAGQLMLVTKSGKDSIYHMTRVDQLKDTILLYEERLGEHYVIPSLVIEKDTITNIRFRLLDQGKKRVLHVMSMTIPSNMSSAFMIERSVRKRYNKLIRTFLLE